MTRKPVITVIGKSARNPGDPVPARALRAGEEVGKLLAERGAVVVTGGLSGVMEAVSRGAKNYVDVAITTGMGWMRNTLVVRAADAVIMISGGIGTLNELNVAYEDKPTVVLEGTGGWSDRIRDIAYEGKHLDEAGINEIRFAKTPAEAVDIALSLAPSAETGKSAEREFRS